MTLKQCPKCKKYLSEGRCLTSDCPLNRSNFTEQHEAMMKEKREALRGSA